MHQKCFGLGMTESHHLPSLPPSICSLASQLPAPVPDVLSQAPSGSWKQKCCCHSQRLSLLVFQLVSHKEMVKHNPLRAAGSRIEFFHLSPGTALYSHTDKTNGLTGSDSDKAADGIGPTSVVSHVMGLDPCPGLRMSLCPSPSCADSGPGFSQLKIMFPDKYLILKN